MGTILLEFVPYFTVHLFFNLVVKDNLKNNIQIKLLQDGSLFYFFIDAMVVYFESVLVV